MKAALKVAEQVRKDKDATQEEIDDAAEALDKAIKALTPATGKNPETGDNAPLGPVLSLCILSFCGILTVTSLRRRIHF